MIIRQPCDEGVMRAGRVAVSCQTNVKSWVLAATILGSSMAFINGSTVNVALPALQSSLGATVIDVQWIINAYMLFLSALILLGGSLGDHFGRRRMFMLGVVIFTAASAWCGLVATPGQMIIARAIQGIGGALLTPGSLAIISASFPEGERGQAIGLWSGFSALTSALGPLLGGWLIDTFSWRWIFYINIPLAIAVLVISALFVPESRDEEVQGGLDWWGALLATLGLGGLTYGLIESSNRGFADLTVILAITLGIVLLIAFVVVELRSPAPLVPLTLFSSRVFSGANGLTLLLYTALGGSLFFLPLNLIQVQGYSATAAGAAFLPMILLLSLLSRWAGGLVSSVGAKRPLIIGPVIAALGFFLFTLPGIGGSYWTTFFPALVVLGLGMSISVAPLTTTVMGSVATHYAGTASGINNAVSRVANLFAIAAMGIVMLGVFSSSLAAQLTTLDIPTEARQDIEASRTDLANIQVPSGLAVEQAALAERVIDEAFVVGFRAVMYIAVVLALASAIVAWLTIADRAPAKQQSELETA
ncbi:MAG: MFS transporter [Chloroflexales bacterium]|nr:MFS transporter [Chloroflexales bacterium]